MTYNIYARKGCVLDREEAIKKVISNRPAWNSARKEILQTACIGNTQEGDLLYSCNTGSVGEFVGFVYDGGDELKAGIKFYEEFNNFKRGTIYRYFSNTISGVFYKVPYFWIDGIPIYDGSVVYGKSNGQKYTAKEGWLIPDNTFYCKTLCHSIENYSAFTTQAPKKEYWVAFCGEIVLGKVDTLENVKKFVKQLGYDPKSESMKYVKVDI